ncbi:MAG: hypothetical protein JSS45_08330 [Proteobacteria bacterium]|nr:hypothetical protein [Pseudomonadota bacterium]MBS0598869.1 hypothetical protein [Pseudomonadota bacterium]
MTVERILKDFVASNDPAAIVLQGDWGIGKTFLWNKILKESPAKTGMFSDYAFVSLFGVDSLDSLKLTVAHAAAPTSDSNGVSGLLRWRWKVAKFIAGAAAVAPAQFGGSAISQAISALSFYTVRDRLVCIDDVERRGSGLSLLDCLGLVTYLVEQRGCRVCVILNSGQLDEKDAGVWNAQKEKVFIAELTYDPSVEQSADLGLSDAASEPWHPAAREAVLELGIKNVRLIRRIARSISLVLNAAAPRLPAVQRRIVRDTALLEFAHSGTALGAPSMQFVVANGSFTLAFNDMKVGRGEKGLEDVQRGWAVLLQRYGSYAKDELFQAIANSVSAGFPDVDSVRSATLVVENSQERDMLRDRFAKAWRLYHDFVSENADETLAAIEESWPLVSSFENPMNLVGVAEMLRRAGKAERASQFIDQWLAERADRPEELDVREMAPYGEIRDEEFLEKLKAFREQRREPVPLDFALTKIGLGELTDDVIGRVADCSAEELVRFLDDNPGRQLSGEILRCLQLSGSDRKVWEEASDRMREALLIIAKRSEWSANRIRHKFGVQLPSG